MAQFATPEAAGVLSEYQALKNSGAITELANGQQVVDKVALQKVTGASVDSAGNVAGATSKNLNTADTGYQAFTSTSKAPTYWDGVKGRFTDVGTWQQAGTMAVIQAGMNIAFGMKPVEAAKSAGASALAYALGTAIAGPVGGWVASTFLAKPIQKVGSKAVKEVKGALDSVGDVLGDAGKAVEKAVKAPVKVVKKVVAPVKKFFKKLGFSDIELKDNIQHIGQTADGINLYSWDWNEKAKEIGLDNHPNKGMIAQDLLASRPEAVFRDDDTGYLAINYEKLA